MSEYLDNEVEVEGEDQDEDYISESTDDENLIIDDETEGNDLSFYRTIDQLENVGDTESILQEELNEQYKEAENLEPNNLLYEGEIIPNNTELKNQEITLKKFKDTFYPRNILAPQPLTLKKALQYAVRFFKHNLKDQCENFENDNVANQFDDDLKIELDLNKFENTCYQINDVLSREYFFLRVYEIKNSYREIRLKKTEKTKIEKELFNCLKIKFNGFEIINRQCNTKARRKFFPIDVLYQPVRDVKEEIKCFLSSDISKSYRSTWKNDGSIIQRKSGQTVYECYYCGKYFRDKQKHLNHLNQCSGIPGVVYDFNTQNLVTYENNIKYKGDLPMTLYFDFETTAPTEETIYDPSQKEMFVMSYVIIICFHPDLNFERIIIERSFAHNIIQLSSISYLSSEQMDFIDRKVLSQLKDLAFQVTRKKNKNVLSEMFCVELFLIKDTLLKWFYKKITSANLSIKMKEKQAFENIPINYETVKCVICDFKLNISPSNYLTSRQEMTYGDFIIRYEHKFLRNIYTPEELKNSNVSTLQEYYSLYSKLIRIYDELNNLEMYTSINDIDENILNEIKSFDDDNETLEELKENITSIEIKNVNEKDNNVTTKKIPSFLIKLVIYIYHNLIELPTQVFHYETIITKMFIKHFFRLARVKYHIHHSHITGKIKGWAHDFCNLALQEKKAELSIVAHNLMKFDAFYVIKGFRGPTWKTKDISMGGSNITNLNFLSIDNVKFIDSMKYFQQSLANLTSTITETEKNAVEKLTRLYFKTHPYFKKVWIYLSEKQKENVLEIICSGKGVIPYEMINDVDSLERVPEEGQLFFNKTQFFSSLKNKQVNEDDFEKSKELYFTLKMRNLGDMNDLYNFQDTALLSEIMESRFQLMQDKYGFNPRKCNSAATFSGCVEREMSKIIIALPTSNEVVSIFENTLNGGFSSVNTRLGFDTEVFLPNNCNRGNNNPIYKDYNYKILYNLADNETQKYRIISKIIKFDENNQYGYAMTKPMPTGCIHLNSDISFKTFNILLEKVNLDDEIGHLYLVDIELDFEKITDKQRIYNEIAPPIIEKNSSIDIFERSTYQLLENSQLLDTGKYKKYQVTKKAHATLFSKNCFPLYLEHLAVLIKRLGWKVTKIHQHYQFEQERFKRDFIIRNQKARQQSQNNVEKDFYKLLNNSNFGYDCRNNLDNCTFVPIFDELDDISYLKKYYSFFDPSVKNFIKEDNLQQDIEQKYLDRLSKLKPSDKYYDIKKNEIENLKKSDLESLKYLHEKNKRQKKRMFAKEYDNFIDLAQQDKKIKSIIDFDKNQMCSIKSLAVKSNSKVNVTTRFMKGKMLMFAKVSILSFNYDMVDVFMFPNEQTKKIYEENDIIKCYLYQNLTDTDSTSLTFLFVCKNNCNLPENKARDLTFEIMLKSKIKSRLDLSNDFWKKFRVQDKSLKKQVGLYEAENIDVPNLITIAINPKEYFEMYKNRTFNNKCKGIRKDTPGMYFEAYADRLNSKDYRDTDKKITQSRLQVKTTSMAVTTVLKNKFAQLNDKRYYFINGVNSLPFGHFLLKEARAFKSSFKENIHEKIVENSSKLIKYERDSLKKNTRLYLFETLLRKQPVLEGIFTEIKPKKIARNTKDYIINGSWR